MSGRMSGRMIGRMYGRMLGLSPSLLLPVIRGDVGPNSGSRRMDRVGECDNQNGGCIVSGMRLEVMRLSRDRAEMGFFGGEVLMSLGTLQR